MSWSPMPASARASCRCFTATRKRRNSAGTNGSILLLPPLVPGRRGFAIDQDEGDAARFCAVIDPSVVGALLHQNVAGRHMNFRVVEQHVDFAIEHDGVV